MRFSGWLSFFCLCPAAALAAQNTSAYTKFDLETACRQVEKGDGTVFAGTWKCPGYKGIDVTVSIEDERASVGFGRKGKETCAYAKTFGRFNSALSPIEWRLRDGKPFAAIQRWKVATDDDGNSATWIVVTALRKGEACPVHYVSGSYPDANADARRAADDIAADFDCEHEVPTVDSRVGPPGVDFISCRELRQK